MIDITNLKAVGKAQGLSNQEIDELIQMIGQERVKLILSGALKLELVEQMFVEFIEIITFSNIRERKNNFFVPGNNGVTTLWMSKNFKRIFLPCVGKTIQFYGGQARLFKLLKTTRYSQMNESIQGPLFQDATQVAAQIIFLISQQPNGEKGILHNDGYANIFFFLNQDKQPCSVDIGWDRQMKLWTCHANAPSEEFWNPNGNLIVSALKPDPQSNGNGTIIVPNGFL